MTAPTPDLPKFDAVLKQFQKAALRFEDSLKAPPSDLQRDAAIRRFGFIIDLSWKTTKTCLEEFKGVKKTSPKDCFRQAYREGLIEYDEAWLHYVDLRNLTSHTYHEEKAQAIYQELPEVLRHIKSLLNTLLKVRPSPPPAA